MRRYDICVIGSKGSGFTYVAYDLVEALSALGARVVGRLQPQSDGSTGRKWLFPPFLGRGDEEYSVATTERTESADLVIMLSPVGNPVSSISGMERGGIAVVDSSQPLIRYWLDRMTEEAWRRGVHLVDVDAEHLLREAKLPIEMRNMFLMGVALAIAKREVSEEVVKRVLVEAYGEEKGLLIYRVVKAGLEYGERVRKSFFG